MTEEEKTILQQAKQIAELQRLADTRLETISRLRWASLQKRKLDALNVWHEAYCRRQHAKAALQKAKEKLRPQRWADGPNGTIVDTFGGAEEYYNGPAYDAYQKNLRECDEYARLRNANNDLLRAERKLCDLMELEPPQPPASEPA